jgi:hypothetical protein
LNNSPADLCRKTQSVGSNPIVHYAAVRGYHEVDVEFWAMECFLNVEFLSFRKMIGVEYLASRGGKIVRKTEYLAN